jgi:branched-chain amino acid transport system ATP-binding protein
MNALLSVDSLVKHYGAIRAVDGVSFDVAAGEILGVIGPNGSGKTTLFNAVLGQTAPTSGTVRLDGNDISGRPPLHLARAGLGRTFQSLQVFGGLTVRDNLVAAAQEHRGSMLSRLVGAPDAGVGARADDAIAFFNLGHVAALKAGGLSYGQQKLVDIAMAFMSEPRLVFLDEPAAGVNPRLIGELAALLRRLNKERAATFVVIEHNMEFVMSLCDRVLVLAEGKVLKIGRPDEVRADPAVLEAYLGA